jgi:hypothetical protein
MSPLVVEARTWGQMGQLEWSWPGGIIRIAGPGESGKFERMVRLVNTPFENIGPDIERATVGAFVRNAYQTSDRAYLREALVQTSIGGLKPNNFLSGVSLPLVAISDSDHIVGALQAIAPGQIITDLLEQGWRREIALSLAIRAVKVASLWVDDPQRRRGVGTALCHSCCAAYFGAGYYLVFGFFRRPEETELKAFYRATGFNILSAGEYVTIGIGDGLGVLEVGADPDQAMFYLTRPQWRKLAVPSLLP